MQIKVVVSSRHHRSHGVSLGVVDSVDFGLKDTNKIQCLLDPLLLWTMADFNICTAFSHFRGPVNTRPVMVTHGSRDQTIPTSTITSLRLSKRWYGQQRVLFGRCHVSYSLHNFLSIPWQRSQLDWSFLLDLLPYEKVVSDSCLGPCQRQCYDDSKMQENIDPLPEWRV